MRRRLAYLLVWLAATGATMGAAWLGLRSVLDVATPHRAAPLSAADLRKSPSPSPVPTPAPVSTTRRANPVAAPTSVKASDTGWAQVSVGWGGPVFQRTFHLDGGELTVLADAHEARVISAHPKPGFAVFTTWWDIRTIVVSFTSGGRSSRVFVSWRDGPYAEVTETSG